MQKLSSTTLPWPADWPALFGASHPLILEIGFGNGHFLVHLARQHPDASIIGVEISSQSLVHTEKAIVRDHLSNVRVIHSTADTALFHLFEPASISEVHVNFPDPWFKKRHSGRRLMNPFTLGGIVNRLAPGGSFYLATDILAYAELSAELLAETPGLTNVLPDTWTLSMPGRVPTKYERKAIAEGRRCYYFARRRNDLPTPQVPVVEELDMPHIIFSSPLNRAAVLERFERQEYHDSDTVIAVLSAYNGSHALLFEVYVREPTIDQRVAVMLAEREDGAYTLKLGNIGTPRPTPGIHKAVGLLGDWLLSLHPDAALIQRKVRG